MKKQLISDRRLRQISTEAAFKLITEAPTKAAAAKLDEAAASYGGGKPENFMRAVVEENLIPESIRAARLAEAQSFPDFEEPKAWDGTAADAGRVADELAAAAVPAEPAPLSGELLKDIQDQFLAAIREKTTGTAAMPEAAPVKELKTPPADPPKDIFFFAHGLAEATGWDRGAVQNWLNYLDFVGYDYMGLGMKNMVVLLPAIIETIRVTERNNAGLATEARIALIRRTLDRKTLDAINRATTAGNRAQRRELKAGGTTRLRFDSQNNSKRLLRGVRGK